MALILILPLKALALDLKVGDVLLQPLNCWSCALIEAQEKSIYSHMGLVIAVRPQIILVEALGQVKYTTLKEFNARTEKGQKLSVRRLRNENHVMNLEARKYELQSLFETQYQGLEYDQEFLWNNFDQFGREKLYCSEMIAKLLNSFLGLKLPTKIMKYDQNRELWVQYFHGNPPDGKPGNAPADFERSSLFYEVGEI
jgi:hypothetical protein